MPERREFIMADFSIEISSDGGTTTFQPDPLNVPAGSLVSWANKTSVNHTVSAPAQGGAGAVPAFATTDTFPGLSTTPEYYIPNTAAAGTPYPYSLDTGETGTITVVAVQDIPDI
jgi:plastocyanin